MTFEELKAAMLNWLGVDAVRLPDTSRGQIVNLCVRELLRKYDLRFGEFTHSFNTTATDQDYDVTDGYSRPYSMWYMNGSSKVNLVYLTKEDFDTRFKDNTTGGAPTHYTIWGNMVYLGPVPDATYAIKFNVFRLLPDLADGSPNNTNEFVEYAWEVVLFRALWYATKYLIEDERAALWEKDAFLLEQALVREHSRERSVHKRPVAAEY